MGREELVEYIINIKGNADQKANTLGRTVDGVTKVAGLATVAVGVMGAATLKAAVEIKQLTDEVAGAIRELEQLSIQSDLSVETLGGLRLAASAAGRELDDIIPDDLSERMFDAVHGGGEMAEIFQRWGIALTDANGAMRTANDVLPEVIESLTEMENKTEASALASILLGDNGRRMLSTFENRAAFEGFVSAADEFGITSGKRAAEVTKEWAQASAELTVSIDTLKAALTDTFGGDVVAAMQLTTQAVFALSLAFEDLVKAGNAITDIMLGFTVGRLGGGALVKFFGLQQEGAEALLPSLWGLVTAWGEAGDKLERFRSIGEQTVDILEDLQPAVDFLAGTSTGGFNVAQDQRTFATPSTSSSRTPRAPKETEDKLAGILDALRAQTPILERQHATLTVLGPELLDGIREGLLLAAREQRNQLATDQAGQLLGGPGGVNSVVGGALGGLAGGPAGVLLGLLPDLLTGGGGIGGVALDLQQQVIDLLDALPETLTQLLSADFLTQLLVNGAEIFIRTFATLPLEMGAAVAVGLVDLFNDLPRAIADALGEVVERITSPFRGSEGRFLGTALGKEAAGDRSFLGVALNNFAAGTPRVRRSGAAIVHEDEMIIPAGIARRMRSGSGGTGSSNNFGGIFINGGNPRSVTQQLQRSLGAYGLNLDLDPVGL